MVKRFIVVKEFRLEAITFEGGCGGAGWPLAADGGGGLHHPGLDLVGVGVGDGLGDDLGLDLRSIWRESRISECP